MSDDEKLAERIARAEIGHVRWLHSSELARGVVIDGWRKRIKTIRRAGLEIVEREDGR